MLDIVAEHGVGDVFRILLGFEFCRVNADDDKIFRVGMLELLEFRQDVHAVDAAERPKIDEHELALQIFQVDRPAGVDPGGASFERRGSQLALLKDLIQCAVLPIGGGSAQRAAQRWRRTLPRTRSPVPDSLPRKCESWGLLSLWTSEAVSASFLPYVISTRSVSEAGSG